MLSGIRTSQPSSSLMKSLVACFSLLRVHVVGHGVNAQLEPKVIVVILKNSYQLAAHRAPTPKATR